MFLLNKYTKWYFSIIEKSKAEVRKKRHGTYYESHHIIPKCVGGIEMVLLTAREHFICHWLLCKMVEGPLKYKMYHAFNAMSLMRNKRKLTAKQYDILKKYNCLVHTGENNPNWGKFGKNSANKCKSWNNESKKRHSIKNSGKNNPNFGNVGEINKMSDTFIIGFNNGNFILVLGLREWCKQNNYYASNCHLVKTGKQKFHKDIISVTKVDQI